MLYFYLTYTVTNNTDEDILLAPSFDLSTETGINVVAGRGVPASVTREILGRLNNPLLNDQVNMIGVLRRGVAHAREGWSCGRSAMSRPTRSACTWRVSAARRPASR